MTDGAPALALGTEGDPDIMDHPPRPPEEPIINRYMVKGHHRSTIAITAATLVHFSWVAARSGALPTKPVFFLRLSLSSRSHFPSSSALILPAQVLSAGKNGLFTNRNMNIAVLVSVLLVLLVIYTPFLQDIFDTTPLRWIDWAEILPLVLVPSIAAEVMKTITYKQHQKDRTDQSSVS